MSISIPSAPIDSLVVYKRLLLSVEQGCMSKVEFGIIEQRFRRAIFPKCGRTAEEGDLKTMEQPGFVGEVPGYVPPLQLETGMRAVIARKLRFETGFR